MKELDQKIIELMDLFDDEQVTTADKIDRPQQALEKEAIDDFMKRNPMAGGGMLVQPGFGGVRQGYAREKKLTKTMEKRISNYESKTGNNYEDQPNWRKKDIRDGNWTGGGKGEKFKDPAFIKEIKSEGSAIQQVRDFLQESIRENKGKPVVFKTIPQIKKLAGVTSTGKGIDGDISRALTGIFKDKVLLRNYEKLPDEVIAEIKTRFSDIISKDQWDFNKYRFGINKKQFTEKVYDRIRLFVQEPEPTRYGFGFNKPEGWMLVQMDRAWRSGNKDYKPIYKTIKGTKRVVGYIDNTPAGQGKKWFVSKDYIKGKNSDGLLLGGGENYDPHLDFTENKKYHDIVQKAGQQPNKAITQILKDGGIDQRVQLRHIVNYLLDNSDLSTTKNSIVRHHRGSLKSATQDLQILNRVQNGKVIGIEKRIREGIINPEDIAKLNKFGVSVRDPNTGILYGRGPTTAEGGLRKINEFILQGSTNRELYGRDIKGLQDFNKKDFANLKTYLSKIGCPDKVPAASGGRIGYKNGPDICPNLGLEKVRTGMQNSTPAQLKNFDKLVKGLRAVGASNIMKFGVLPEALFEGALIADKMASEGDSFAQGLRNSYLAIPFQAMGIAKTYEEGRRDEVLAAAPESQRGQVQDVFNMQDSLNKKNQLRQEMFNLEKQKQQTDAISDGSFGYVGDTKDLDNRILKRRQELEGLYDDPRSKLGKVSRDEKLLTGSPLDLNIKDQLTMDAYNQAVEKSDADRASNILFAPGTGLEDVQIKKRMGELPVTPELAKEQLQATGDFFGTGYTPLSLNNLFTLLGREDPQFGIDKETGKYSEEKGLNDYMNYLRTLNFAENFRDEKAAGGRAGFKLGSVRKGIQALIDEGVKKTPKDITPDLNALIKKTLDEDFFDKKDRIIDQLDITAAKKRKNFPYNQKVQEEPDQLEFYDDITKSNFRTKTGPFFDRRKKAGGGILKQAGDSSGPPPESGPMSEGLQGLMKRGIKT
jgi:hypothetical protein